jgi:flagellar hook-basal body complex protein FliE
MAVLTGASAYAAIQAQANKMMASAGGVGGSAEAAQGGGFADILGKVMNDTVAQSKAAEGAMAAQVQGKAELIDVVTAISSAEASLETVLAVRDQVIAAYQEIMRMPI